MAVRTTSYHGSVIAYNRAPLFLVPFQIISYAKPVPPFVQTGGEVQNGGRSSGPARTLSTPRGGTGLRKIPGFAPGYLSARSVEEGQ